MLHFLISVKNVGINFSPDQGILCELATLIKNITPGQNPEVYFEFSRAKKFVIKPDLEEIYPTESTLVEIYPQDGMINKEMITPDIAELAQAINTLTIILMDASNDLDTDSPIRTSITACPGTNFKFVDHTIVGSF